MEEIIAQLLNTLFRFLQVRVTVTVCSVPADPNDKHVLGTTRNFAQPSTFITTKRHINVIQSFVIEHYLIAFLFKCTQGEADPNIAIRQVYAV